MIYLTFHLPYESKTRNWNEIMNEFTIFISTESMLFYTELLDIEGKGYAGWFVVILFLINMIINLLVVFY